MQLFELLVLLTLLLRAEKNSDNLICSVWIEIRKLSNCLSHHDQFNKAIIIKYWNIFIILTDRNLPQICYYQILFFATVILRRIVQHVYLGFSAILEHLLLYHTLNNNKPKLPRHYFWPRLYMKVGIFYKIRANRAARTRWKLLWPK